MVAQVVPPPFAEQLSISVFGYQVLALERMRVQARLALLAGMTEVYFDHNRNGMVLLCISGKFRTNIAQLREISRNRRWGRGWRAG